MSRPRKILTALAVAGAWACFASGSAWASCPSTTTQASGLSQAQLNDSITCLINEQRAAYGLPTVQPNGTLQLAAQSHSAEMVSDGYFAHTSPAGVTFIDRIQAAGYMQGARSWLVGENLAWGTASLSSPAAVVQAWMDSPPHRENLLRAKFREVGVAAVRGTPDSSTDANGITVSSEYGYRAGGKARKVRPRRRHR